MPRIPARLLIAAIPLIGLVALAGWPDAPGDPRPHFDYFSELDSMVYATDPARNAWPLIQEVEVLAPASDAPFGSPNYFPDEWKAYAAENEIALDLLRQAAHCEKLGRPIDQATYLVRQAEFHDQRGDVEEADRYWSKATQLDEIDRTNWFSGQTSSLLATRVYGNLLVASALSHTERSSFDLAADDLIAASKLGRLYSERPFAIEQMIGLAIESIGYEGLMRWLRENGPDIPRVTLDRVSTFASLDRSERSIADRTLCEWMWIQTSIQHSFSDGGDGGGELTPRGLDLLEMRASSGSGTISAVQSTTEDLFASIHAGRDETLELLQALRTAALSEVHDPTNEGAVERIRNSLDPYRHGVVMTLDPAVGIFALRDASRSGSLLPPLRTWIATVQFRQDLGRWPTSGSELVPEYLDRLPVSGDPYPRIEFIPESAVEPPKWSGNRGFW